MIGNQRTRTVAFGLVLMILAVPLVFLALLFGSGGEMITFIQFRTELLALAALVGLPLLMFCIGLALLWASRSRRYTLAFALTWLMAIDAAAFTGLNWLQNRPGPEPVISAGDPNAVIRPAVMMQPESPELRVVGVSPSPQIQTIPKPGGDPTAVPPPVSAHVHRGS